MCYSLFFNHIIYYLWYPLRKGRGIIFIGNSTISLYEKILPMTSASCNGTTLDCNGSRIFSFITSFDAHIRSSSIAANKYVYYYKDGYVLPLAGTDAHYAAPQRPALQNSYNFFLICI